MLVVILCLLAVFMVNHNGLIRATRIFANNPAVLCVVGKEFNVPLRFPYNSIIVKYSSPISFFSLFVNINSPFWNFNDRLKDLTIAKLSLKRGAKLPDKTVYAA